MPHFNQPHAPILGKFRSDETLNASMTKYNGHTSNQYSVPYTQQSAEDKQRSLAASTSSSYPQSSIPSNSAATSQSTQPPEISQDLCNAILQQQNDAKRGKTIKLKIL